MQPTSDGLNSSTVCQPSVIMLCLPSQCEDTSTIGPGSRYRRTLLTGKSDFACRFMVSHQQCAGDSGAMNGSSVILRPAISGASSRQFALSMPPGLCVILAALALQPDLIVTQGPPATAALHQQRTTNPDRIRRRHRPVP